MECYFALQIGNYHDDQVSQLVPFGDQLDDDVWELFCSVFTRDNKNRPTALDLLGHHLICNGEESYQQLRNSIHRTISQFTAAHAFQKILDEQDYAWVIDEEPSNVEDKRFEFADSQI